MPRLSLDHRYRLRRAAANAVTRRHVTGQGAAALGSRIDRLGIHSGTPFVEAAIRREDRARRDEVSAIVASLLAADALDLATIMILARRELFPVATASLCRIACNLADHNVMSLLSVLFDAQVRPDTRLFRIAVTFGAASATDIRRADSFRPEKLRADASSKRERKAERARLSFAAFGQPLGEWPALSRRERAAFALHCLVQRFRDRAS